MAGTESVATQTGAAQGEDVETAVAVANPGVSDREAEIERIAARKAAEHGEIVVEKPEAAPAVVVEKPAAPLDLSTDAQLGQQLEDGGIVLDEATMARAMVRVKVDGKEELVPATKALGQYQKNGAADVRLAEATRMSKQAAEILQQANEKLATASTPAARAEAAADVAAANERAKGIKQDFFNAFFEGDTEKASQLFDQAVQALMPAQQASSTGPTLEQIVDQAVPALKQRLSVDSALDKLFSDYPEIASDPDMTLIADAKRASYEAQGKSRAEALALAGEDVGIKYKLGKHAAKGTGDDPAPTTRAQKLAAKEGLDEPQATAARAATHAQPAPTNSSIIAEMAKARGQSL